jgi:hypothetical protein
MKRSQSAPSFVTSHGGSTPISTTPPSVSSTVALIKSAAAMLAAGSMLSYSAALQQPVGAFGTSIAHRAQLHAVLHAPSYHADMCFVENLPFPAESLLLNNYSSGVDRDVAFPLSLCLATPPEVDVPDGAHDTSLALGRIRRRCQYNNNNNNPGNDDDDHDDQQN